MWCECGKRALTAPRVGKKRSRRARAGQKYSIKDHDMCQRCWESLNDSMKAKSVPPLIGVVRQEVFFFYSIIASNTLPFPFLEKAVPATAVRSVDARR